MAKFTSYPNKAKPTDSDTLLINDASSSSNKQVLFSAVLSWFKDKLALSTIDGLDTTDKTVVGAINEINTTVGNKADSSSVYTKSQVDALIESVDVETDTTLSVSGKPADAKTVGDELSQLQAELDSLDDRVEALETGGGGQLSSDFSTAMTTLLSHLTGTFDDEHGQDYIDAVIASLDNSGGGGDNPDPSGGDDEQGLPEQYQEVEYIIADCTQYFETNVSAGSLPIRVEVGLYKTYQARSEQVVVIAKDGATTAWEVAYAGVDNRIFAYSNTSASITNALVYGQKNDVVARFNQSIPYKQLEITANGTTLTAENTTANNDAAGSSTSIIKFFGASSSVALVGCRMYYCKIYNADDELVLDMVPCRLKTSQDGGLYDRVSGTYYQSTTGSHFTTGPDVTAEGGNE